MQSETVWKKLYNTKMQIFEVKRDFFNFIEVRGISYWYTTVIKLKGEFYYYF